MGTVHWIGIHIKCSTQTIALKNIRSDMNYIKKYSIPEGSSGSNKWPEQSASERLRENAYYEWYFLIQVTCNMNAKGQAWQ